MGKDYCVYMHKNKINGKKYIGVSKNIKLRFGKNGSNYKNQPFYKEIEKYGWEEFEHIILYKNLTKNNAEKKEMKLIAKYNTTKNDFGYNKSKGYISSKIKKNYFILHINIDNNLKEQLKKEASEKGLSLSSYIRMILLERGT